MIAEEATKSIEQAVCHELRNIVKKYGPTYASEHEGYAVLLEEVEEALEPGFIYVSLQEFIKCFFPFLHKRLLWEELYHKIYKN